ncbi:uncharacterized protein LOC129578315 isoform X2 [Sitodiplosis mosellana]|uniref:uncharacterized protein LOC129578315 isoform X2 n=1 Tax=Sitodiplosis mosellana TaxID=263140 RepID=UPI0024446EB2|nr:uncharacterized protein LOC129578315 isoform X2 [Sitodiplosis mosellana]
MQQPHKYSINENSASSATNKIPSSFKKGSVKINGQVSIEPNRQDVPTVPPKPARQAIGLKREMGADTLIATGNGQMKANHSSSSAAVAPVASTTETDEIEFLLEEIKDLEAPACRTDSEQDFEIAGSRVDLDLSLQLDSPIDTSYSHAYFANAIQMPSVPWGVPLHCDLRPLKTPTGIIRILLVISSAACIVCEFSAGSVQVGLFFLPLIARLRFMVFCAIFSLLLTSLMLFLDISHIALMFPFHWPKLNAYLYFIISIIFLIGSSLLIHMVFFAREYMWVPKHSRDTLFLSAMLGYTCAIEAMVLSVMGFFPSRRYRQVPADECDCIIDEGRELTPMSSTHKSLANSNSNFHIAADDIITDRR